MTSLTDFSREAAKRYLQSIVFVDDEIYRRETGEPVEVTTDILSLKSPFISEDPAPDVEERAVPELKPPYHPRQLVESFAREGMVCALYEPKAGFANDNGSEIFKLCERADVLILDWDLFGEDGSNILPLIANLVDQRQNTIPHHARLCAIYTTKQDLERVANAVYENLRTCGLKLEPVQKTTLVAGATRVVVWGKPNVVGRTPESQLLEVPEDKLAGHVIDEFAKMHSGILPSYALHGMASVRRNSKRILEKFHSDMDGEFLLHRASLLATEDAFEQLPELLAEELLAVLLDDQVSPEDSNTIAKEGAANIQLQQLDWPPIPGTNPQQKQELARRFLGGETAIATDCKSKRFPFEQFHAAMRCEETHADKRLAALFNLRTRYVKSSLPSLGLGTIVRWRDEENTDATPDYSLCLMPVCDSVRLEHGTGKPTAFPFWKLKTNKGGATGLGFVVQTKEKTYVDLLVAGKPRDMLWLDRFAPSNSRTVLAAEENSSFLFRGDDHHRLEWVAQLKPAHAQRIALYIGQAFSRVAVFEAEWLRLRSDGKSP